ncbi:MAG TPA: MBL fold metallo-hydrolase [Polyangia bacterium]
MTNPKTGANSGDSLTFLGAAGTVTGSKHLLTLGGNRVLLDCGLFQGLKSLRLRNWGPPPVPPASIDALVLSHAHLDHSGYLPVLVREGFRGPIFCTRGTADLLPLLLRDSGRIQEQDAERANRYHYTKHKPALPLYTAADAENVLPLLKPQAYGTPFSVSDGVRATFHRAGHILGSAITAIEAGPLRIVFSGDLGRWGRPILRDPEFVEEADIVLVEGTYGDRRHGDDPEEALAQVLTQAAHRGGAVIVPAFAVGRTQELIWTIRKLENAGRVPLLSVYLDSPLGNSVTSLYCRHPEDHDLDMAALMDEKRCPLCCRQYNVVTTGEESKRLNGLTGPMVIIAGSGMATGGRVLHHLKYRLPDPRNTVLLAGYQAEGTRGRLLQDGAKFIKIHGDVVPVRAQVATIDGLSAHADQAEILRWLRGFRRPPRSLYVVHAEAGPAATLARRVHEELGWPTEVAGDGMVVPLSTSVPVA